MDTTTYKALVLRSFESERMDLEAFIPVFYKNFFELRPEARAIFPTDTERLEAKLLASLTHIAEALESNERLDGILSELGQKHRKMQISDSHFEGFIESFTSSLATIFGPEWNRETNEAWTQFLHFVAKRMSFFASSSPTESST